LSALDMILQRQVPARSVGKQGETGAPANSGDQSGDDPFSAVLSGQQRQTNTAQKHRSEVAGESQIATGPDDLDPGVLDATVSGLDPTSPGRSDDMLALLEGLMTSASFADNTPLVASASAASETETAIAAQTLPEEDQTATAVDAASELATGLAAGSQTMQTIKVAERRDPARSGQDRNEVIRPEAGMAANPAHVTSQAALAKTAATPPPAATATAQATLAMPAQISTASGRANAQDAPQDRVKAPVEVRETLRVLGVDAEAPRVNANESRGSLEDRFRNQSDRKSINLARQQEERLEGKPRNVEVLESRRFVGVQQMSGNSEMLTRSLIDAGNSISTGQRAAAAQSAAIPGQPQSGQMLQTLKLQLNPVSLGAVTAELKLSGEELSVNIKVETAEAYRQLSDDNQAILKALRAQGYGVEHVNIQHIAGTDRSTGQAPQSGFQNSLQGTGSGDAEASGKQSGGQNRNDQSGGRDEGQRHEQNPYAGPGAVRTDGVYL
jgi:chemotaxis protein MotD